MTVAENLFQNILVFFIIVVIFVIIYCRVKNQTLVEVIREWFGSSNE